MEITNPLKLRKKDIEDFQQSMINKALVTLEKNLIDNFNKELSTKKTLVDLERFNYFIHTLRTEEYLDGRYLSVLLKDIKRILGIIGLEVTKIEASQRIKPGHYVTASDHYSSVNCLSFIIHFSSELGEM